MAGFIPCITVLSIMSIMLPKVSSAEDGSTRPAVTMEEVLVRSNRIDNFGEDLPAFVEIIPVKGTSSTTLADLLSSAVGVQVKRYGGLGSFSTVSIRGSTAEQVVVYLDGVPLNQAIGGGADVGRMSLGGVQEIQVYRGAVPARFGGNSIGGVVNVRTATPDSVKGISATFSRGSLGTTQFSSTIRGKFYGSQLLVLGEYLVSQNDFRFLDDNGTEYNEFDDEWVRRSNNDFLSWRGMARIERSLGGTTLNIRSTLDLKKQGIPGIGNFQANDTRLDGLLSVTELELYGSQSIAGVSGGYRWTGYYLEQRDKFRDPHGEVGPRAENNRNRSSTVGMRSEFNTLLPSVKSLFTLHSSARRESFIPRDLLRKPTTLLSSMRKAMVVGIEGELPLGLSFLRVTAGGQTEFIRDKIGDSGYSTTGGVSVTRDQVDRNLRGGRLGVVFNVNGIRLTSHYGRYERAPNFYELFGDRGAIVGNTELESEDSNQFDIGVRYRTLKKSSRRALIKLAEISVYRHDVRNLIRFIQNSQYVSRSHNIGRAYNRGLEMRMEIDSGEPICKNCGLMLGGFRYTYSVAENQSPFPHERGKDLPNTPRHVFGTTTTYMNGRHTVRYEYEHESSHFLDRSNLRVVPGRSIQSLAITVGFGIFEFAGEIRNITDNQIADIWGYPLPGRSFFVNVSKST